MGGRIIEAKLIAIRQGDYTTYVFQNTKDNTYVMCTRLPNWHSPNINVGDEGFLKYIEVSAGEKYYNSSTGTSHVYNYSNVYFENFILKQEVENSNIIL